MIGTPCIVALALSATAAEREHTLVWDLSAGGKPIGSRNLVVRYLDGEGGTSRVLESYTEIDGQIGPTRLRWRQRMTAHVDAREPASFHSVIDHDGTPIEVQGRWTPSAWVVTTLANGRPRTVEMPLTRIDLSTADLFDPDTRVPLSHFSGVRILSAETGEVLTGPVEQLGVREVTIAGKSVSVTTYAWSSPHGRWELSYSADGYLVRSVTQLLGITLEAQLRQAPPGGIDDFPVGVGPASIEALDL
jgi:hypothetical protein